MLGKWFGGGGDGPRRDSLVGQCLKRCYQALNCLFSEKPAILTGADIIQRATSLVGHHRQSSGQGLNWCDAKIFVGGKDK